jgi:hypothetical protein
MWITFKMTRFPSEDPNTVPASPERVYDEAEINSFRYASGRLLLSVARTDLGGNLDPTDEGRDIKFRDFDADLIRATKLGTLSDKMIVGLGALYREHRLIDKIAQATEAGADPAVIIALEARLASVRDILGVK